MIANPKPEFLPGTQVTVILYLEYRLMANNNAGAYWLSNEKEIKNRYFGDAMGNGDKMHNFDDKMRKCGSVKEMTSICIPLS